MIETYIKADELEKS
ncbi:Protein of unknown function [Leuconostoc citreum LBAE C11]|nr:Protein of unknown function [Leuconostoc citreum LBAE C11]